MATNSNTPLLSYDDYAAIDDDERYEVLEGVLVPMGAAPFLRHQRIVMNLAMKLSAYLERHPIGEVFFAPVDVVLESQRPATVVQPDLLFMRAANRHRLTEKNVQGPPDLVIEVLSPSNAQRDSVHKRRLYERFGVEEYWLVPSNFDRIEVLRRGDTGRYGRPQLFESGDTLTSEVLPGFELAIAPLFPAEEV